MVNGIDRIRERVLAHDPPKCKRCGGVVPRLYLTVIYRLDRATRYAVTPEFFEILEYGVTRFRG
jgi:hypothetical protein